MVVRDVADQPARNLITFARATREALESVAAPPIAASLLHRAVAASGSASVPEDAASFRAFVDGPLRAELQRSLGAGAVTLVLGRLTQLVTDQPTISSWPPRANGAHQSGSHPVIRTREPFPQEATSAKRPTLPAPAIARAPVPARTDDAPPRRLRPPAATVPAMTAVGPVLPSCVLVVSLDASYVHDVEREIAGRCPVIVIGDAEDLARIAARAGARIVVLVGPLPAIDLPTFVDVAPILPPDTRVVLWGTDERTLQRLTPGLPATHTWIASGSSTTPGAFALSLR